MFSMVWTAYTQESNQVILDVSGLDIKQQHVCVFTDAVNTKLQKITAVRCLAHGALSQPFVPS